MRCLLLPLAAAAAVAARAAAAARLPAPAAVRGVWISRHDCPAQAACDAAVAGALDAGANTLFVDAWADGAAYFAAPSAPAAGPDVVGWAVNASAGRAAVVAWLEYGNIAQYGACTNALCTRAAREGWLLGDDGAYQWLDPSRDETRALLRGLVDDALAAYGGGLAGVQLDDHFAWPAALGGTPAAMTAAARALSAAAAAAGGAGRLLLSPAPLSFALAHYNVDWGAWADEGLFAGYAPQLYRTTDAAFESELATTLKRVPAALVSVGVRSDGSGAPTPRGELSAMLAGAIAAGAGVVVWEVKSVAADPSFFRTYFAGDPPPPTPPPGAACAAACCACIAGGGGTACGARCGACGAACVDCVEGGGGAGCAPDPCACARPRG